MLISGIHIRIVLRKLFLGSLPLIGLCSCGNGHTPESHLEFGVLPSITVHDSDYTEIRFSDSTKEIDIADPQQCTVTCLELSSQGRNFISDVTRLLIHNDRIYILDWRSEQLFIYDRQGRCLKKIDARGRGPEEYLGLLTMAIDSNRLWVQDRMAPQMLIYTLDGEFEKKVARPVHISDWTRVQGKSLYYYQPEQNGHTDLGSTTLCTGTLDSVLYAGFPVCPLQKTTFDLSAFCPSFDSERVLFKPQWSDTVYRFTDGAVCTVEYVVEHPESIWQNRDRQMSLSEIREARYDGRYISFDKLIEGRDRVLIELTETEERSREYLYDKASGQLYKLKDGYPILPWIRAVEENCFVVALGTENLLYLKDRLRSGEITITDSRLRELISGTDENANPILLFLNFRLPQS